MTRQTSIQAYNDITNNGLLKKLKFAVYNELYNSGPSTAQEIWVKIKKSSNTITNSKDGIHQRLSELERMGVVKEIGTRQCSITGRVVIEWDVTDKLPSKQKSKKTFKNKYEDLLHRLSMASLLSEKDLKNEVNTLISEFSQ